MVYPPVTRLTTDRAYPTLHYGGAIVEGPGTYYEPTVLMNVSRDNPSTFRLITWQPQIPGALLHLKRRLDRPTRP